jgi:HlyD family secretion protein
LFLHKFSSPENAFSLFALFVASGARILPSILRIQGSLAQIKSSEALSNQTFLLLEEMNEFNSVLSPRQINKLEIGYLLKINSLKFSYPEKPGWNLHVDELSVASNRKIAIVGPSGSGKSTLIDLILGVLTPSEGTIEFLGRSDAGVPVAFIPQRIAVLNRSVRENVAFGVSPVDISDAKVWDCITIAGLTDLIAGYPN